MRKSGLETQDQRVYTVHTVSTGSMSMATRETIINLRASATRSALIDQAAEISGKSRTDFMLDAASEKAQEVLLDRTVFALDSRKFKRFLDLLSKPAPNEEALRKLLSRKVPWEPTSK